MRIRLGYRIGFDCPAPTSMLLVLTPRPERMADLLTPHQMQFDPPIPSRDYLDGFGNICTRIVAPPGPLLISANAMIRDTGLPDAVSPQAAEVPLDQLPDDVQVFLLGSRYCDTDRLSSLAWSLFGHTPRGWARVQAVVAYVHNRIRFDYQLADATRSASEGHYQQVGVCRDFAHLAVTFCRCLNIPARYCTGYLGDIGVPIAPEPMDFSAWFEVYLDGRWWTFDARHNKQRIGRVLIGRGRDATDVAISTSFGTSILTRFDVITEEVTTVLA